MLTTMAKGQAKLVPATKWLVVSAALAALALPALAQEIDRLVVFRPDNRAGSAAAAAVIAEMIAERSESAAVRSRARSIAPQGALSVGADELLMDIGAHAFIASVTGGGAVLPVAVAPVTRPVAPTPAPVVETVVVPTPTPVAPPVAATPAAAPVATAPAASPVAATAAAPRAGQNWGVSESFSGEMRDLGGSAGSGGGGGGGWN